MRFKTKVINVDLFLRIVQSVQKINKEGYIRLSPDKIQFIIPSENIEGMQVWSGMNVTTLFEDYRIESLNNNEIGFGINFDNLQRALKSGITSHDMSIRLTKKNGAPTLSIFIEIQAIQTMQIMQDIPIELLSATQLSQLIEPNLPDPSVYILMPRLKKVQKVIDRMKNICDFLKIHADMAGQMHLSIETDMVSITTFYNNLEHPQIQGKSPPRRDSEHVAEATIDIKQFAKFLYSHQVSPTNVVCCIIESRALVFHVMLEDLYMTYYIPVISNMEV